MKKQTRILMVIALMIWTLGAFAQKPFAGKITFEMSAEGTSDPNIAAQLSEQTVEYTVMGNCSRMEVSQGIDVITIANGNNKTYTVILGIPGYGKYYIQQTEEDLQKKLATTKYDFKYTEETKTVTGYNCKKVIVTVTDLETDEEITETLWVTTELGLGDDINFYEYPGLKGYVLSSEATKELNGEKITIIQTATKIVPDKKVKATNFLMPSDAKPLEDAPEELKQMLGGMDGNDEE
jgi:hypothetical protein